MVFEIMQTTSNGISQCPRKVAENQNFSTDESQILEKFGREVRSAHEDI
jgi:hypothetical protein